MSRRSDVIDAIRQQVVDSSALVDSLDQVVGRSVHVHEIQIHKQMVELVRISEVTNDDGDRKHLRIGVGVAVFVDASLSEDFDAQLDGLLDQVAAAIAAWEDGEATNKIVCIELDDEITWETTLGEGNMELYRAAGFVIEVDYEINV